MPATSAHRVLDWGNADFREFHTSTHFVNRARIRHSAPGGGGCWGSRGSRKKTTYRAIHPRTAAGDQGAPPPTSTRGAWVDPYTAVLEAGLNPSTAATERWANCCDRRFSGPRFLRSKDLVFFLRRAPQAHCPDGRRLVRALPPSGRRGPASRAHCRAVCA
jgi:hypothetical protein